jgi:hypothetical protein
MKTGSVCGSNTSYYADDGKQKQMTLTGSEFICKIKN